jgi:predicted ArsR family transcriptional regulator
MDDSVPPDDVLAQPTRRQLLGLLGEIGRDAGTEELAASLGLHPNGVRVHLERLREAGLVERVRTRQARGRPRDMWSLDPRALASIQPQRAYADLGRWLARAISPGRNSLRAVQASGREAGRAMAQDAGAASPETAMHATLAAMGFAPARRVELAGALTYELCNCPYRDAVRENQPVVCTLHRGITQGLLDVLAPETQLTAFVPRDPVTAGCLIELSGGLADEAEPSRPHPAADPPS